MTDNSDGSGVVGQLGLNSDTSEYNGRDAQIESWLGRIATIRVVKVVGVKSAGEVAAPGLVDIKPLVNLVDGVLGGAQQHGTIYGVPYVRVQSGKMSIIMDPIVGDIGLALVADRDISAVKQTKDYGPPGSFRRFSLSDAIYLGGILNGVPEQYIRFNSTGVSIADKNGNLLEMKSDGFHFNKPVFIDGALNMSGNIQSLAGSGYAGNFITSGTIQSGTIVLGTHRHTGIVVGGGTSAGPVP